MKPAIFVSTSVLVGLLFAFQEWLSIRNMGYHFPALLIAESWGFQFLMWGIICWLLWRLLGPQIQRATLLATISVFLPLSILSSLAQQMLYVFVFQNIPPDRPEPSYWHRLSMYVYAELLDNMLIFWCAFLLFRGIGYYQRNREQEDAKSELEIQLANAQLAALRMQLNPHFLFNAMNSISSLMRSDLEAADNMLEQLSCLLRMSLERGESQLISLREEIEFIELYLDMQGRRYMGRVKQTANFEPELYDALVPSMLLQPLVENAYVHGLSRTVTPGVLVLEGCRVGQQMRLTITNSGIGLNPRSDRETDGHGVGLNNIRKRLELHYGANSFFEIAQIDPRLVRVTILLPIEFSSDKVKPLAIARLESYDPRCAPG